MVIGCIPIFVMKNKTIQILTFLKVFVLYKISDFSYQILTELQCRKLRDKNVNFSITILRKFKFKTDN